MLRKNDYSSLLVDDLRVLTTHPLIGAMAAVLAGVDSIRLWHDQLLFKPSVDDGVTRNVGWHTDRQYWLSASSDRMLTGWVPFHDVRPDHGPVMFVDGSHRWETHATGDFWNHDLDALAKVASGHDAHVSQALVPRGGISFHHCRTVHGSGPNISGEPRRAIAVHLQDGANEFRHFTSPDGRRRRARPRRPGPQAPRRPARLQRPAMCADLAHLSERPPDPPHPPAPAASPPPSRPAPNPARFG